jgi:ATP-dependent DNA helicase RecQ
VKGPDDELDAAAQVLSHALRRYRLTLAREAGVVPFIIASDLTLRDIVRLQLCTLDDLGLTHGIGRLKTERYGDALLRVIGDTLDAASAPRG